MISAIADLSGDGRPELIYSCGTALHALENRSTPGVLSFPDGGTRLELGVTLGGYSVEPVDLDDDGELELVLRYRLPDAGGGIGAFSLSVDADAGLPDAGLRDAGLLDAGLPDAGPADAGATDAGATDAGATDAGSMDGGAMDAGATDAGQPALDAGQLPDAGRGSATLQVGCGCNTVLAPLALVALAFALRRRACVGGGLGRSASRRACGRRRANAAAAPESGNRPSSSDGLGGAGGTARSTA